MASKLHMSILVAAAIAAGSLAATAAEVPPYTQDFEFTGFKKPPLSDFGFTQIDNNGDGDAWAVAKGSYGRYVTLFYTDGVDDYLVSPAITLEAGATYDVSFDLACNYDEYYQKFEIVYGKQATAAGLDKTALGPTVAQDQAMKTYTATVVVDEAGDYYFAVHAMNNDDGQQGRYFSADNFTVKQGVKLVAPAAVTDLAVQRDPTGLYEATITCKAPLADQNGAALTALQKVEVSDGAAVVHTFDTPAPGDELEWKDVRTAAGYVTYTVTAYNDEGAGVPAEAQTHLGVNKPLAPASVTVTEDPATDGRVILSWPAVAKDIDGNDIPAGKVRYLAAYQYGDGDYIELTPEAIGELTVAHQAVPEGHQTFYRARVWAVTEGGQSDEGTRSAYITIGTPFELPFISSFNPDKPGQLYFHDELEGGGQWGVQDDSKSNDVKAQDGDGYFGYFMAFDAGSYSTLWSGKLAVGDAEPVFTYYIYNITIDGQNTNEGTIELLVADDSGAVTVVDKVKICDLPRTEAWNRHIVDLKAYKGRVIRLGLRGTRAASRYLAVDNMSLAPMYDTDLAATGLRLPSGATAGTDITATVSVANVGRNAVNDYRVELLRDGEVVGTAAGTPVACDATANVTVTFTEPAADTADPYMSYTARVVAAGDPVADNDATAAPVTMYVRPFPMPAAPELTARPDGAAALLTWTALDPAKPYAVTEDFEDYNPWLTESAGGWTMVDRDGLPVNSLDINLAKNGIYGERSFFTMTSEGDYAENYPSHSGRRHMQQLSVYNTAGTPACDDWLISPRLPGTTQQVSLWARGFGATSLETFELRYSTTGNRPEDFTELATRYRNIPNEWSEYRFQILDATYFAIVCTSEDKWMMGIDDITYTPAATLPYTVTGYKVWRDGSLVATLGADAVSYTDDTAADGTHTYALQAVLDKGETALSPEVTVEVSGIDDIDADSPAHAEYYNLQGIRISGDIAPGTVVIERRGTRITKTVK